MAKKEWSDEEIQRLKDDVTTKLHNTRKDVKLRLIRSTLIDVETFLNHLLKPEPEPEPLPATSWTPTPEPEPKKAKKSS